MATHAFRTYSLEKFWDVEFKTLEYINEPFNDPYDVAKWISQGYQSKICGDLCVMRHSLPSWNNKFIEFFEAQGWHDVGCAYYRMGTGTVMPVHQDRYVRYIDKFRLHGQEYRIKRALVLLEDWKSGHYLELMGSPVVDWKAGQVYEWTYDTPHMAANLGLDNRYTLQITGWSDSYNILDADGAEMHYAGNEIIYSHTDALDDVFSWCTERGIDADLLWTGTRRNGVRSEWGIKDEAQRTMFALQWA